AVFAFMESRRLLVRISLALLLGLGTTALFLTYTRSAWIGFTLVLLLMGILRYRRLLLIAAVGIALAAFVAPGAAREAQLRFGDLTSKSEAAAANSWTWRVDQWSAMIPYGFDRPLTGQGWGSYTRLTVRRFGHLDKRYPTVLYPALGVYSKVGFSAHNDYVKDFVELGVPGLVLWVLTLLGLAGVAWRARAVTEARGLATTMVGCAIALMLISAADNLQGYTVVLTYVFALCGALAGVAAARRSAPGAPEPAFAASVVAAPEEVPPAVAPVVTAAADEPRTIAEASPARRLRSRLRRLVSRARGSR
ncbi:MAG: hypothetical protein QOJ29_1867, partial [Thermoleophilaceae bacterium]|nr:hypothetical protein [Thermoleophilaceae bacterium]